MDVLSHYQVRAAAPLDKVARLLGLPGKTGLTGLRQVPAAGERPYLREFVADWALEG